MKRYLNKALIYKEWKAIYWILIPSILFNSKVFTIYNLINQVKAQDKMINLAVAYRKFFKMNISNYIIIILIILMAYIMVNNDIKNTPRSLINHMPFNIKQRIFSKIVVGEFVIFLSCFIGYITNTIMYKGNINYIGKEIRFEYVILYFIISFLVYTIIYILFVYVQCICKNRIFGVILAVSILQLPIFMEEVLYYFWGLRFYKFTYQLESLTIRHYLNLPLNSKIVNNNEYITGYKFMTSIIKLSIILVVICTLLILFIKKMKISEGMMFRMSPKKERVFKIFSSISIGILVAGRLSSLFHMPGPLSICDILINIVFIIFVYFLYSQINKLSKPEDRGV